MNEFALNIPYNSVSFGQLGQLISREIASKGLNPCIFPIGQVDLSAQDNLPQEYANWLQNNINKSLKTHRRENNVLKLWHINGSLESISNNQILLTFWECDSPTAEELNIIRNNKKVIVTNEYTKNILEEYGCKNIVKVPLAFDKYNFMKLDKKYFNDGRINFLFPGKFEITRKRTVKVIQAWIKKFGNNPKYFLNCAIHNVFIPQDQLNNLYNQILGGNKVGNVQFLNYMPKNSQVNDCINSNEIVIGMGTEGWNYPLFHALCLSKHVVALNVAGHKEFCNAENSVLVSPSAKIPIYENMFFHPNQPFNQGNCYDFSEDEFIAACEEAIKRVENNPTNENGAKLQEQFSSEKLVDTLLKEI